MSRVPLLAALCAALLSACAESAPNHARSFFQLGPLPIGSSLLVGVDGDRALTALDVAEGRATDIRRLHLDAPPTLITGSPEGTSPAAFILSREARTLTHLDVTTGAQRSYALGAPFDGLLVAPDGRSALAYYAPNSTRPVFHNADAVAHIDLDPARDPAAAVTSRTLASLGGKLRLVEVSPRVAGTYYALFLTDNHVAVVDMDHPQRPERSVPLVSLTSSEAHEPLSVSFDIESDTLWALLAVSRSASLYALAISPAPETEAGFKVRLSQVPGGSSARLLTLPLPTGDALYSVSIDPLALRDLVLTDLASANSYTLRLPGEVEHLQLFESAGLPHALLWSTRTPEGSFHTVDLVAAARQQSRAVRTRVTQGRLQRILPIPGTQRFLAVHDRADQGLSLVDAERDRITSFGTTGTIDALHLAPDLDRAYALTSLLGQRWLITLELSSLHTEASSIPAGAKTLALMPDAATVAAIDDAPGGLVTLWPLFEPSDDNATVVPGFLLDALFDR